MHTSLKNFPQFVVIHIVKGVNVVNEAEVDVFLEFPYFFYDPMDIGNLISGSSTFSKSSLYILKSLVRILLKPSLEDFEHYTANMGNECNCKVIWAFFGIGMKTDLFQSCGHCWVFQITVSSFRIWNSSAGIPSSPLSLFVLSFYTGKPEMDEFAKQNTLCTHKFLGAEWIHDSLI